MNVWQVQRLTVVNQGLEEDLRNQVAGTGYAAQQEMVAETIESLQVMMCHGWCLYDGFGVVTYRKERQGNASDQGEA